MKLSVAYILAFKRLNMWNFSVIFHTRWSMKLEVRSVNLLEMGGVTARKMWYLISLKSLLGTLVCNLWSIVPANCVLVLRF